MSRSPGAGSCSIASVTGGSLGGLRRGRNARGNESEQSETTCRMIFPQFAAASSSGSILSTAPAS